VSGSAAGSSSPHNVTSIPDSWSSAARKKSIPLSPEEQGNRGRAARKNKFDEAQSTVNDIVNRLMSEDDVYPIAELDTVLNKLKEVSSSNANRYGNTRHGRLRSISLSVSEDEFNKILAFKEKERLYLKKVELPTSVWVRNAVFSYMAFRVNQMVEESVTSKRQKLAESEARRKSKKA
jgi:hypothetical protein